MAGPMPPIPESLCVHQQREDGRGHQADLTFAMPGATRAQTRRVQLLIDRIPKRTQYPL
jgi:hypothetical protein